MFLVFSQPHLEQLHVRLFSALAEGGGIWLFSPLFLER